MHLKLMDIDSLFPGALTLNQFASFLLFLHMNQVFCTKGSYSVCRTVMK